MTASFDCAAMEKGEPMRQAEKVLEVAVQYTHSDHTQSLHESKAICFLMYQPLAPNVSQVGRNRQN